MSSHKLRYFWLNYLQKAMLFQNDLSNSNMRTVELSNNYSLDILPVNVKVEFTMFTFENNWTRSIWNLHIKENGTVVYEYIPSKCKCCFMW